MKLREYIYIPLVHLPADVTFAQCLDAKLILYYYFYVCSLCLSLFIYVYYMCLFVLKSKAMLGSLTVCA